MGQRKYPPLRPSDVIAILESLGFSKRNQVGSHAQYLRPRSPQHPAAIVTVDLHYDTFDDNIMKSMIAQSTFSRDRFYGATKATAKKANVRQYQPDASE